MSTELIPQAMQNELELAALNHALLESYAMTRTNRGGFRVKAWDLYKWARKLDLMDHGELLLVTAMVKRDEMLSHNGSKGWE